MFQNLVYSRFVKVRFSTGLDGELHVLHDKSHQALRMTDICLIDYSLVFLGFSYT